MTPHYCIKATTPDRGEDMQPCPICRKETRKGEIACTGCGYRFPALNTRRSRLHHESLISFPRSADSVTGKDMIFL